MSRKDYVLIARALRNAREFAEGDDDQKMIDVVADQIAVELHGDNANFNRRKFLEAAEYKALQV